ncbi:MAG: serine/threonine-protein kinase [Jatrophihabitans sp.]
MAIAARTHDPGPYLSDRFSDVHVLRAGSQFTVYDAFEDATRRRVALKVPDANRTSWLCDVLRAEGRVLAAVGGHPNIVTLLQSFDLHDGRPALMLERCVGSLSDHLATDARVSLQEAVAIGIKLAGALETVHTAGVLHCDVRPDNVLVSEYGEPVLAGFDEAVIDTSTASRPPQHITTAHTAPELLEGAKPTPRTDVYGLGATLYELIAGRAAFREYAGESAATVIVRVLSGRVKPIIAPDVPLEMSDLLTWAMAADPAQRPPSPAWLAEELRRMESREGWPRTRLLSA